MNTIRILAVLALLTACANAPTAPAPKRPTPPPTIEPPRIYPDTPTVRP